MSTNGPIIQKQQRLHQQHFITRLEVVYNQLKKKKDFEKLKGHQLPEVTKKLKMSAGLNNLNFKYIYSIGKIVKQKILSS